MEILHLTVTPESETTHNLRLDKFIIQSHENLTRSQLQNRFDSAKVNGKIAKLSTRLAEGDEIECELNDIVLPSFTPELIDLDICYEDDQTLIINKPQGMVVHPGAGHHSGTLVNALLGAQLLDSELVVDYNDIDPSESFRPGIVHRLDKDTSGLILVAKNLKAHQYYSSLFKKKKIKKQYIAIVKGVLPMREGVIESFLARDRQNRKKFVMTENRGKNAITRYRVLAEQGRYSLLALTLVTGRTHQIRVHLSGSGYPIVGDPLYARKDKDFPEETLMLHAWKLAFDNFSEKKKVRLKAPIPERILNLMKILELKNSLLDEQ